MDVEHDGRRENVTTPKTGEKEEEPKTDEKKDEEKAPVTPMEEGSKDGDESTAPATATATERDEVLLRLFSVELDHCELCLAGVDSFGRTIIGASCGSAVVPGRFCSAAAAVSGTASE